MDCLHMGQWRMKTNTTDHIAQRSIICVECGNTLWLMQWSHEQVAARQQWRAERRKNYDKKPYRLRCVHGTRNNVICSDCAKMFPGVAITPSGQTVCACATWAQIEVIIDPRIAHHPTCPRRGTP